MRRVLFIAGALMMLAGASVFLPSRLVAQKSCACSVNCTFGDCNCSASAGAWVDCVCGCTWYGRATCNCLGDP